jgi:hypothetical protein
MRTSISYYILPAGFLMALFFDEKKLLIALKPPRNSSKEKMQGRESCMRRKEACSHACSNA